MAPTVWYGLRRPGDPPDDRDRALLRARDIIRRDTCTDCGHALSDTTELDAVGEYVAEVFWCEACKIREREARKNTDPPPGRKMMVVRRQD